MVPRKAVNIKIFDPITNSAGVGDYTIIKDQGYQGIIVFNLGSDLYTAFDLGCPYINPNECQTPMTVENGTGQMSCANCSNDDISFTQYQTAVTIEEGGVEKTYALRQYSAFLEGGGLRITNF